MNKTIWLPKDLYDAIKKAAEEDGLKMASWIVYTLTQAIKRRK